MRALSAPVRSEYQDRQRFRKGRRPPNTRPAPKSSVTTVSGRPLAEGNDYYRPVIAVLNDRWRVVQCAGGIQWILQQAYGRPKRWRTQSYCRTREGLIFCVREHAGEIDDGAFVRLLRLPKWIGGPP